jgi:penicillin amidase
VPHLRKGITALITLALLAIVGAYGYLRLSLPQIEGEVALAGVAGPVEILRDRHGIPHIYAQSLEDAHFGLGFVHAQDRLWQMEMSRRTAAGRLAEVVGPAALEADRFLRTLGIHRVALANLRHYAPESRRLLDAYAAGVNVFLATAPVLPPEFWLLWVSPEPWTPADSVAGLKMMAWDLGGNWRNELLRMQLSKTLPVSRIQEFLPPYPGDPPVELPDLNALYGPLEREPTQISGSDPDFSGGLGSNSWVVSGSRSVTGKPLLANDPHLALTAPSVWYLAHLHAPGIDAIGGTLPGVPGILIGRTERIAWGFTNTGPDVQDLYLEKLDAAGNYLAPDGARPFEVIEETIKVRGREDERHRIRISRHGPVISDVSRSALEATPRRHVLAFAWTALAEDDRTLQAALKLSRVQDWAGFVEVGRDLHAPQQNVTYADTAGNIGFIAPGRVPIRKRQNDLKGLAPAPGWDARYDWAGYIPYAELPRAFNPRSGFLVSANQKIVPAGYRHHITSEWEPPYRARRITQLLQATSTHTVETFASMQSDVVSLAVRELLPALKAAQPKSRQASDALRRLAAWDGTMAADRAEPLLVTAWWRELARTLYADELGDAFRLNWNPHAVFVANVLADRGGQSRWCDDLRTPQVESCDELLSASLERALADLRQRFGKNISKWNWGDAHTALHRHRPFPRNSWPARLFDVRVPSGGDSYTVNAGHPNFANDAEPYVNRHAASLRAIYDLSDPQASVFIQSTGQSGNPLSPQYRAFAPLWARGEYVPMVTERGRLEAAGVQRLVLVPRG